MLNYETEYKAFINKFFFFCSELKKCCVSYLGESLNPTNCLDIQMSGEMFNCPSLSDTAETLAAQNFDKVIQQAQFKELGKKEAIKFLSSRDQKVHVFIFLEFF